MRLSQRGMSSKEKQMNQGRSRDHVGVDPAHQPQAQTGRPAVKPAICAAGSLSASSPGCGGRAASWSAGSDFPGFFFNSPASLSSSGDFERVSSFPKGSYPLSRVCILVIRLTADPNAGAQFTLTGRTSNEPPFLFQIFCGNGSGSDVAPRQPRRTTIAQGATPRSMEPCYGDR